LLQSSASPSRPHSHESALLSTGAISTSVSGSSDPDLTQRVDSHSQATTSTDTAAKPPAHSKATPTASDTKDLQAALQQMMISRQQAAAAGPSTTEDQNGNSAPPSSKKPWGANLTQRFKASLTWLTGGLTSIKHTQHPCVDMTTQRPWSWSDFASMCSLFVAQSPKLLYMALWESACLQQLLLMLQMHSDLHMQ